jgi:hypothetical protein
MPAEYKQYGRDWEDFNPGWTVTDWDSSSLHLNDTQVWRNAAVLDDLLANGEKEGADKIALATHLADVLAYELVFEFGGLYVNTDMQPVKSLDTLFENHPALYETAGAGKEDDHYVVNAVMWAPEPGMYFWERVIAELPGRYFGMYGDYMSNTTGPHLLTMVYNWFPDLLHVVDKQVFNPLHFTEVEFGQDAKFNAWELPAETITVHHWGHRKNRRNQRVLES